MSSTLPGDSGWHNHYRPGSRFLDIPKLEMLPCPFGCMRVFPPKSYRHCHGCRHHTPIIGEQEYEAASCEKCGRRQCDRCRVAYTDGHDCPTNKPAPSPAKRRRPPEPKPLKRSESDRERLAWDELKRTTKERHHVSN